MTLKRKILFMFAVFVLLTLAGSWIIFREFTKEQLAAQNENDLANFAVILGRQFENDGLKSIEERVKAADGLRVTLIEPSGRVLFDSVEDARKMDNHLSRPEVTMAYTSAAGEGSSLRYSDTMKIWFNYYALKLNGGNVIRLASPIKNMDRIFSAGRAKFFIWIAPAFLMLSFLWVWLTKRLFTPIEQLIESAGGVRLSEKEAGLPK
ncbi:MAG: hypothetical protein FWG09_02470, partial [Synergistaceae bacterium]|nr:hypothetical protein [Synergistaceae bacterium]